MAFIASAEVYQYARALGLLGSVLGEVRLAR